MAEDTYAGYHCYLIIEKQGTNSDTPALPQCPLPLDLIYDATPVTPNIVRQNGIMYISSTYTSPFDTSGATPFSNILDGALTGDPALKGWVFNIDTGEGRYYDGTEAGDESIYWRPEQRAIGRIYNFKPKTDRPVNEMPEIGAMYPAALKSGRYSNSFSFDKTWIDKQKLSHGTIAAPIDTRTIPVWNQYGSRGDGLVMVNEFVTTLKQNYYLTIVYAVDNTNDANNIARVWLFPCSKYENIELDVNTDAPINASISGKATYCRAIPEDVVTTYTHSYTP